MKVRELLEVLSKKKPLSVRKTLERMQIRKKRWTREKYLGKGFTVKFGRSKGVRDKAVILKWEQHSHVSQQVTLTGTIRPWPPDMPRGDRFDYRTWIEPMDWFEITGYPLRLTPEAVDRIEKWIKGKMAKVRQK